MSVTCERCLELEKEIERLKKQIRFLRRMPKDKSISILRSNALMPNLHPEQQ